MKAMRPILLTLALLASGGCDRDGAGAPVGQPPAGAEVAAAPPVTNRIDVPPAVRQNLGITFAKVERRRVAATVRVPGRFELLPSARREYRAVVPGRVELLVDPFDRVEPDTPLLRVRSPEWSKLRQQLLDDEAAARRGAAEVAAAEAARAEAERVVEILRQRVAALAEAGTRRAELELQLAERQASLPRLEAEIGVKRAEADAAAQRMPLTLASAASLLGRPVEYVTEAVPGPGGGAVPRWRTLDEIEVAARAAGVVESVGVANGSWAEAAQLLVATVDPAAVRFRASALQSDLAKLRDGSDAVILPPAGGGAGAEEPLVGKLALGLAADPQTRTLDLIVTPGRAVAWARPGLSSFAEVVTGGSAEPELAIPVNAVVQDGLARVFFRRDPRNPDKVVRVEGDLGVSDGRWVVVQSGVREGDEVVLDGVFELNLVGAGGTQGGPQRGGHFHADGTWHADGTPEPGAKK